MSEQQIGHFRAWANVPLSDRRGQVLVISYQMQMNFERNLNPWQRVTKKSNGRFIRRLKLVRPIRGIHLRTISARIGK